MPERTISPTAHVYDGVVLGRDTAISDYVIVGHPRESDYRATTHEQRPPTRLADGVVILPFSIIYDGAKVGAGVVIEERAKVGYEVCLGRDTRLTNGAIVSDRAQVGERCVVSGRISERTVVGDDCQVIGSVIHSHGHPHVPWGIMEPAPVLDDRVVVGYGALVIGHVRIESNVYIAANAIVTRDVPAQTVVVGVNDQRPAAEWKGAFPQKEFWEWSGGTR